jgi:putative nucleotidyltransferase with HDIG domain
MNRQDALDILYKYTKSDNLRKHALAVETAMRAYARKFGESEETWGITGLLHDFDYEMYPTIPDHPVKGSEILQELGYPEEIRKAILGHAHYTNVPRETLMARTLFACDELAGFIIAVTLVRPSKKIADVEVTSIKKKMKDKAFARNVSREDIVLGAQELEVPLDEHMQCILEAMKSVADDLGL